MEQDMSKIEDKGFSDWWAKIGYNLTRSMDLDMNDVEAVYNYQQNKIEQLKTFFTIAQKKNDRLEKENQELRETSKNLKVSLVAIECELQQQRFNNEHNLSIDQKVSDEIKELLEALDLATNTYFTEPEVDKNCEVWKQIRQRFKLDKDAP